MKILFIYFNSKYRPRTLLSLSIIETIAKKLGHSTRIFDSSFYSCFFDKKDFHTLDAGIFKAADNLHIPPKRTDPYEDLKRVVDDFQPQLIAFSFYINQINAQRAILAPLKKEFPEIKILAGGSQCILNPEESIKEPYIDMMCYGEGEEFFKSLSEKMDRGEDISAIQGLWLKTDGGDILRNAITRLTELDNVPVQDWDSYDPMHIYGLFDGHAFRMGHVEFTRGCHYSCTYCGQKFIRNAFAKSGQKGFVRHKSPLIAVNEYKELKEKYDLEMFYFVDGNFSAMPTSILEELAKLYREKVGLPFIAQVHPQSINERKAELLGLMGCKHVSIGVESGNEEYRENVMGRKMSNRQIVNAIHWLKRNGVKVSTYNIIGMPGMDRKHVFETIDLNREAKADTSIVASFVPYPDSEITRRLINKGMLDPGKIKIVTQGTEPTIEIKEMSADEIKGLYSTFNLYLNLPKFTFPAIKMLERSGHVTNFVRKQIYRLMR